MFFNKRMREKRLKRTFDYLFRSILFYQIFKEVRKNWVKFHKDKQLNPYPKNFLNSPSHKGKITGYEPFYLDKVKLKTHELMIGSPGSGLSESTFSEVAIRLGQTGELNFAKALQKEHLLDRLLSFWSIHNLDLNGEKTDADVDCILVSSTTIWLIDLKFYLSGDVTYKSDDWHFYTFDNETGLQVKKPKTMTRNMSYAEKAFLKKFEKISKYFQIKSRVVLMPTNNGAGKVDNVYWPGKIKAITLEEILKELCNEPSFRDTIGGQLIKQTFNTLVKR